jgi:hypothetical protein
MKNKKSTYVNGSSKRRKVVSRDLISLKVCLDLIEFLFCDRCTANVRSSRVLCEGRDRSEKEDNRGDPSNKHGGKLADGSEIDLALKGALNSQPMKSICPCLSTLYTSPRASPRASQVSFLFRLL